MALPHSAAETNVQSLSNRPCTPTCNPSRFAHQRHILARNLNSGIKKNEINLFVCSCRSVAPWERSRRRLGYMAGAGTQWHQSGDEPCRLLGLQDQKESALGVPNRRTGHTDCDRRPRISGLSNQPRCLHRQQRDYSRSGAGCLP